MNNFIKNINALINFYCKKESIPFVIPVLVGVLYKLNTIILFIVPIQAIQSVSKGRLSKQMQEVFKTFHLPVVNGDGVFFAFSIIILLAVISLLILDKLKIKYIIKIKSIHYTKKESEKNLFNNKEFANKLNINKKIDNFIKNSENIFFCSILSIFIFIYDFQIALIILFGCFIYIKFINISNSKIANGNIINKKNNLSKNSIPKKRSANANFQKTKINYSLVKPIASSIIMFLIMALIYLRSNSSISIIFIFLVRIFQNNMLNSIKSISQSKKITL